MTRVLLLGNYQQRAAFFGRETMKTKKIAGVDLGSECFAFVGDLEDPKTWKLPVYFPNDAAKTRNHIKNAVERFADCKIPDDEQRTEVWRVIAGAAKAHGIKAGAQPASALPGSAHPSNHTEGADALDVEAKTALALGALHAERFLKSIGYGGT
jgi:hypothetical protein